ncbi:hypothetical protein GpartN1_g2398.t1 [Galdieria partita]|uniref:Nucleolar protein 16 n=1 Tax=Galdieria partita TaxID=83374 RepID=A0A9C7PVC1_9RHOD|nr:hypothetical protein GpartN1_g2398.t1 [Galdieria partita]
MAKKGKLYLGRSAKATIRKRQARLGTSRITKKLVRDSALKPLWSPKQRAAAQLEQLGIAYDSNKCLTRETPNNNSNSKLVEYYEQLSKQKIRRDPKHLTRSEKLYLSNIFHKYGTNFERAFRDTKLNYLQWTETQLAKYYTIWLNENKLC